MLNQVKQLLNQLLNQNVKPGLPPPQLRPLPLDNLHVNFEATLASFAYNVQPSVAAKSKAFSKVLSPLGTAHATRLKAWINWKTVITWAIANNALDNILPKDQSTFQALQWELTALGAAHPNLKGVIDAVAGQHREAKLPSPLSGNLSYQLERLNKSLARVIGKPHLCKCGVTRDMVATSPPCGKLCPSSN